MNNKVNYHKMRVKRKRMTGKKNGQRFCLISLRNCQRTVRARLSLYCMYCYVKSVTRTVNIRTVNIRTVNIDA